MNGQWSNLGLVDFEWFGSGLSGLGLGVSGLVGAGNKKEIIKPPRVPDHQKLKNKSQKNQNAKTRVPGIDWFGTHPSLPFSPTPC